MLNLDGSFGYPKLHVGRLNINKRLTDDKKDITFIYNTGLREASNSNLNNSANTNSMAEVIETNSKLLSTHTLNLLDLENKTSSTQSLLNSTITGVIKNTKDDVLFLKAETNSLRSGFYDLSETVHLQLEQQDHEEYKD